jgi:competence ComEA-like helix-hairpin-helix protein
LKARFIVSLLFAAALAFAGPVDINRANSTELEKVKGVGKALAVRIVEYRKANGPFKSIDDLSKVSGIGSTTLEKMKPWLTVSPAGLNLNTATAKELEALPGIGKVLAERIIDYRKANGLFESLNDLSAVKGVNQAMIGTWSGRLMVAGVERPKTPKKLKIYRPGR